MTEGVIAALIAGGVAIIVTIIENSSTRKLMEYQINELRKSVERHNSVVERTYELEKKADVYEEKLEIINRDISDIKKCKFNN